MADVTIYTWNEITIPTSNNDSPYDAAKWRAWCDGVGAYSCACDFVREHAYCKHPEREKINGYYFSYDFDDDNVYTGEYAGYKNSWYIEFVSESVYGFNDSIYCDMCEALGVERLELDDITNSDEERKERAEFILNYLEKNNIAYDEEVTLHLETVIDQLTDEAQDYFYEMEEDDEDDEDGEDW